MFASVSQYEPGHHYRDGCVFPDPHHLMPRTHNPNNEILADIRLYRAERLKMNNPKDWAYILRVFERVDAKGVYVTNGWTRVTSTDMIEHTKKVLTRLANLEKMDS